MDGVSLVRTHAAHLLSSDAMAKLEALDVERVFRVCHSSQRFCTIGHGDLYSNNILFSSPLPPSPPLAPTLSPSLSSPSSPPPPSPLLSKSLRGIVDFQFCNWGRPAIDIHSLLCTSVSPAVRRDFEASLLHCYYAATKRGRRIREEVERERERKAGEGERERGEGRFWTWEECLEDYRDCFALGFLIAIASFGTNVPHLESEDEAAKEVIRRRTAEAIEDFVRLPFW